MTAAKKPTPPADTARPLREQVAHYITKHEGRTAAEIAAALGRGSAQGHVNNALNELRTEGLIEVERSGKPPMMRYSRAVPADDLMSAAIYTSTAPLDMPAGIALGTRKSQIWHALRGGKRLTARQITTALQLMAGTCDPTISEMMRTGQLARSKNGSGVYMYHHPEAKQHPAQPALAKNTGSDVSARSPGIPPAEAVAVPESAPAASTPAPVAADDVMPDQDEVQLVAHHLVLVPATRLDGVAHVLRGCGLDGLRHVTSDMDLQPAAAALSGAYQLALAELDEARKMIDTLDHRLRLHVDAVADKLGKRQDSQYLIYRGVSAAPIYTNSIDDARTLASNAARDHALRADVFALVPVGAAVPAGVEWVQA